MDPEADDVASTHFVHTMMRFAVAVRHRKTIVIACLTIALLLGGLYFLTATRYYSAHAGMLVLQVGGEYWSPSGTQRNLEKTVLPTYERLITSARVLEGALKYLQPEDRIDLAGVPRQKWAAALRKNLTARSVRKTNIMHVSFESKDPHAAVAVVNAVVQSYQEFSDETYKSTAAEIIEILTREKQQLAEQLAQKQEELLEAQRSLGDMGISVESKTLHPLVQRAVSLNEKVIAAQAKRVELEANLAVLRAAFRNGEDLQQYALSIINSVGDHLLLANLGLSREDSVTQASLQRDLLNYRTELEKLQDHLGPAHPDVVALVDKIRITEQYLAGYRDRIRESVAQIKNDQLGPMMINMLEQQAKQAWQHESSLQAEFNQTQAEAVALNDRLGKIQILEHDLKWLRELHDVLLKRIAGLELKHEGLDIRTTVVEDPVANPRPVSPKLFSTILLCSVFGLAAGLLIVYLLDVLDDHFRSLEEMQAILRVPVLAMIQQLQPPGTAGVQALQIVASPEASESEAFRTLRTSLLLSDQETRRVVISSSEPGDGKTTVLANLAAALAQSQKKTLLIDADLRRPGLTAVLGMRNLGGLSGVIGGEEDLAGIASESIRASGLANLDVLPSGPRPSNPAELLAGPRFAELLAWAEAVYDHILIDSPPALAASDTAVIGRLVDGVMLVVQPAKNRRRMLIRTIDSFSLLKIPILGVVVNRVDAENAYYYGYGEGYHYHYDYGSQEPEADTACEVEGRGPAAWQGQSGFEGSGTRHDLLPGIVPRRVA